MKRVILFFVAVLVGQMAIAADQKEVRQCDDTVACPITEQKVEKVDQSEASCSHAVPSLRNLRGEKFKKGNYDGQDFSRSDLSKAKFKKASLKSANFSNSILDGVDFKKCVIDGAIFTGATVNGKPVDQGWLSSQKALWSAGKQPIF